MLFLDDQGLSQKSVASIFGGTLLLRIATLTSVKSRMTIKTSEYQTSNIFFSRIGRKWDIKHWIEFQNMGDFINKEWKKNQQKTRKRLAIKISSHLVFFTILNDQTQTEKSVASIFRGVWLKSKENKKKNKRKNPQEIIGYQFRSRFHVFETSFWKIEFTNRFRNMGDFLNQPAFEIHSSFSYLKKLQKRSHVFLDMSVKISCDLIPIAISTCD